MQHASVLTCARCQKLIAVLLDTRDALAEHPYVFACPWCQRLVRRSLLGVLMRVVRATADETPR